MLERPAISFGDSHCSLAPESGGSIASWTIGGQNLLRPMHGGEHALHSASFPLVPYSNRIAYARFSWNGKAIHLTSHAEAAPHALHGVGWERSWTIQCQASDRVTLGLKHAGDEDWPFAFSAEQHFTIGSDWLEIRFQAKNDEAFPVPLAFGHHPYFENRGATLRFSADYFHPATLDGLPADKRPITSSTDFSAGKAIQQCDVDNIFAGWNGEGWIEWKDRPLALHIASDLPHAVVYTPKGCDYFCFEPVPHINNALNRADGDMDLIAPGATCNGYIRFSAIPT